MNKLCKYACGIKCMYAETAGRIYADFGCIYADIGCISMETDVGCIYADVGCLSMKRLGA